VRDESHDPLQGLGRPRRLLALSALDDVALGELIQKSFRRLVQHGETLSVGGVRVVPHQRIMPRSARGGRADEEEPPSSEIELTAPRIIEKGSPLGGGELQRWALGVLAVPQQDLASGPRHLDARVGSAER
jgi:hypothetical protein